MDDPKSKMNKFIAKKLGFPIFNRLLIKGSKGGLMLILEKENYIFFNFILYNFLVRTLRYFLKKIQQFFCPAKT